MGQERFGLPEVDPFSTLDGEIARLNAFFASLRPGDWRRPTRCEGWTIRSMVAHLDSDEEYNEACLNASLEDLLADFTSLDEFNDRQIQKRVHLSNEQMLNQWRTRQGKVRQAWQKLGLGAKIPTSVGPYPMHAQIWHITSEYATHADDMGVEVPESEQKSRIQWRCQFSAFAVQEKKDPPELMQRDDRMVVTMKDRQISLSQEDFVAAVGARLPLPENPGDRQIIEALRSLA